jgi:hypothetical protein
MAKTKKNAAAVALGRLSGKGGKGSTGGWFRSLLALDVAGMPRTMRMEYPGAIYHVMDRGDRRESGSRLAGKVF